MNERIKELADKSGFGPAWYDPTIPTSDIDRRWIDQRRLKEFAELIIKEYEQLLPEHCPWAKAEEKGPMQGWHVAFVARKHFGVEQ